MNDGIYTSRGHEKLTGKETELAENNSYCPKHIWAIICLGVVMAGMVLAGIFKNRRVKGGQDDR